MSRGLEGKVVVITGSSRGLGYACAERFCEEKCRVVLSDVEEDAGRAAAGRLTDAGGEAIFIPCDVGDSAQVNALVDRTVETWGALDVMVSNAGILAQHDFLDFPEDDFDKVIRVNLKGVFLTGQAAARQMVKQETGGAIVNMSSVNAILAIPNTTPYAMAKGGINQLTKVMAVSLATRNIRVNAVGPGTILTEMAQKVMANEEARRTVLSRTPMGRCGEPSEIASVVAFLASEDASYITGTCVYPDGGRLGLNYTVPVAD